MSSANIYVITIIVIVVVVVIIAIAIVIAIAIAITIAIIIIIERNHFKLIKAIYDIVTFNQIENNSPNIIITNYRNA